MTLTLEVYKVSPYIIWWVFDHMLVKFEQNRMVRNTQNFKAFSKKCLTIFEKVLRPFLKTFLWHKQLFNAKILFERLIFHCSKNANWYSITMKDHSLRFLEKRTIFSPFKNNFCYKVSNFYHIKIKKHRMTLNCGFCPLIHFMITLGKYKDSKL